MWVVEMTDYRVGLVLMITAFGVVVLVLAGLTAAAIPFVAAEAGMVGYMIGRRQ